jgi:hypothetical protein
VAGGAEVQDLDLEVPHPRHTTPCVARTMRGAGHGEGVSREHDPIGLEDTWEEHVLPQHAFSSALAAPSQGWAAAGCSVAILFLRLREVGLVQMLFSFLFYLDLDFFLGADAGLL